MQHDWAIDSERALFPATHPLPSGSTSKGKALLTRPTELPLPARTDLELSPLTGERDWLAYENLRLEVEAGFGVGAQAARDMVAALRRRPVTMLLARSGPGDVVGAIGHFGPGPWARLQEVDVFPAWRGRGYGDALLSATLLRLSSLGFATAIVGADEDDWPLGWYRRRGFTDAARVPLTR